MSWSSFDQPHHVGHTSGLSTRDGEYCSQEQSRRTRLSKRCRGNQAGQTQLPRSRSTTMVPGKGFEPLLPCGKQILSLPRLPFRHPGWHVAASTATRFMLAEDGASPAGLSCRHDASPHSRTTARRRAPSCRAPRGQERRSRRELLLSRRRVCGPCASLCPPAI